MRQPQHYGDHQLAIYQQGLKGQRSRLPMGMEALEAAADHIRELVPESPIPPEEAARMFRLGGNSNLKVPLRRGLMLLSKWKEWWTQDPGLDEADRDELHVLWAKVRSAHVRAWTRQNPLAFRLTGGPWARRAKARLASRWS
jgi:hypothetical protein